MGTEQAGALAGIRVIDFGQYLAGPLAGMLLADQGADVVHVDPPGGPRWDTPANASWNRGKQAITLDLKAPDDLAIARRLAAGADVILENFRPHVMDRLGLGPEAVMAANPGVVYCSLPGFAADDPRAGLPGWEGVVSAAAAAYSPLARPGETPGTGGPDAPVFSAVPIASGFAAFLAAAGVAAALRARRHLHRGQRLEIPLFDAMFVALGYRASKLPPGPRRRPQQNRPPPRSGPARWPASASWTWPSSWPARRAGGPWPSSAPTWSRSRCPPSAPGAAWAWPAAAPRPCSARSTWT